MPSNYWTSLALQRLSRRRLIAASSAATAGAALLAACGGSSSSGSGSSGGSSAAAAASPGAQKDTSGLLTASVDTTKQAKRGGTFKFYATGDAPSLDPMTSNINLNQVQHSVYGRLTQLKAGYNVARVFEVIPDLAESWEWSPDRLQLTLKLRQGVKFHNKPPVNARLFDSADVAASWDIFSKQSPSRSTMANSASPDAPVLSLTATDPATVVIKLKEPLVFLLAFLANNIPGYLAVLPKESGSTLDLRRDEIGTGPYIMDKYTPAVGWTLKRNPDYYEKDLPLIDTVEMPIVLEYAQGVAQLKAGNLYTYAVRGEDVISVKKETPDLAMFLLDPVPSEQKTAFGWLPAGKSVFNDERVRQAISLSYDRDLFIDTFFNVTPLQKQGLPVDTRWNSHLAMIDGWWIDPRNTKDFGANAKYFQHDVAMAKQLLSAAGFASGLEVTSSYIGGAQYGTDYQKQIEVLQGMNGDAGIKFKNNIVDYQTEFIPKYRDSVGQFEGLTYKQGPRPSEDPAARAEFDFYSKSGQNFLGYSTNGTPGDPYVDQAFLKARAEIDDGKRKAILFDLQNYLAKAQYGIRFPGGASGFGLAWPALANFNVFRGDARDGMYNYWIDDTKAPLKKS